MTDIKNFYFPQCATHVCKRAITVGLNYQSRLSNIAFIKDCKCHVCPLICHQCRWRRNPGICYTIRPNNSDWKKTMFPAIKLYYSSKILE